MAIAQMDTRLSANKLFKTIESMPPTELGRLFVHILAVRAQHKAPRLAAAESRLLLRINKGLPADLRKRLTLLSSKRRRNLLKAQEHDELLRLTARLEAEEAARAEALAELAKLRGVTMTALMRTLGIRRPRYV